MRQDLIAMKREVRDIRDRLHALAERADLGDHWQDDGYAREALAAIQRNTHAVAEAIGQLANHRAPRPACLDPAAKRHADRREEALADPDAVLGGIDPYVVSCTQGSLRLRFALRDTDADNALLADVLLARGWATHDGSTTGITYWRRPGAIADRLAAAGRAA